MGDITTNVIYLIDKSGMADMEIERQIGAPRSSVYDWRKGRSKSYRKYLPELARVLNVPIEAFYADYSTPPAAPEKDLRLISVSPEQMVDEIKKAVDKAFADYEAAAPKEKPAAGAGSGVDILDEVDVAFYGEYKELDDRDKEAVRDFVRVMRERRAREGK